MKPAAARYRAVVRIQLWGLAAIVLIFMLDEYLDLPQYVFNDAITPLRHHEFLMESGFLMLVAALVIVLSRVTFRRASELESLLVMCAWCGQVRDGDEWTSIETFLRDRTDTRATRGLCPSCYERNDGSSTTLPTRR